MYSFHRLWPDDTTSINLSPLELLEKLSLFMPRPRVHLIRYAGCLAPHSTLRDAIVPHRGNRVWTARK
jgi:putative transposase